MATATLHSDPTHSRAKLTCFNKILLRSGFSFEYLKKKIKQKLFYICGHALYKI